MSKKKTFFNTLYKHRISADGKLYVGVNEKRGEKEIEIPTIERGSETERGREEKEGGRER